MVLTTFPLSEVPSFPKCISYALQTLCLRNIALTEQLQSAMEDFMVGISTTDGTDGSSSHFKAILIHIGVLLGSYDY